MSIPVTRQRDWGTHAEILLPQSASNPRGWLAENETHLVVSEKATTDQCVGRIAASGTHLSTGMFAAGDVACKAVAEWRWR
jgi:hypothetical protein